MKESKKYRIRPARSPQEHKLLSGVIEVQLKGSKHTAFIHFDESLVEAVGKALPQGLSPGNEGYIKVIELPNGVWRIMAMYVRETKGTILWESKEKPSWIGKLR